MRRYNVSDYEFLKGEFACCKNCPQSTPDGCLGNCEKSHYLGNIYRLKKQSEEDFVQEMTYLCPECFIKFVRKSREVVNFT